MTNFLEYRPHLEYKRQLRAVLQEYKGLEETVTGGDDDLFEHAINPITNLPYSDEPHKPKTPAPSTQLAYPGYVPSRAIEERVDLTPTDVLVKLIEAVTKIDEAVEQIIEELRTEVTVSPSIDDYIKAKEEGNLDVVYEFEDFHSDNIEGSTGAEVLPVLDGFKEELADLTDFIGEFVFPNELAKDLPYLTEQLDRLHEEEKEALTELIKQDAHHSLDEDKLNEENHLLEFVYQRGDSIVDFVEEVTLVVSQSPANVYHGAGEQIQAMLPSESELRIQFETLIKRRFAKHARNLEDAKQRMGRLVDRQFKTKLLRRVEKMQEEKLQSRDTLNAMFFMSPPEEEDPLNIFFMDMAEEIRDTRDECDALVEDLYRITELEDIQNIDYLTSLEGKNTCRGLTKT